LGNSYRENSKRGKGLKKGIEALKGKKPREEGAQCVYSKDLKGGEVNKALQRKRA